MTAHQAITSHATLLERMEELKAERTIHERKLQEISKEFVESLNPAKKVKRFFHEMAADKDIQTDLSKIAVTAGSDFLIGKTFGKYRSIAGFVSSLVIENVSSGFLNKHIYNFINNVKKSTLSK